MGGGGIVYAERNIGLTTEEIQYAKMCQSTCFCKQRRPKSVC